MLLELICDCEVCAKHLIIHHVRRRTNMRPSSCLCSCIRTLMQTSEARLKSVWDYLTSQSGGNGGGGGGGNGQSDALALWLMRERARGSLAWARNEFPSFAGSPSAPASTNNDAAAGVFAGANASWWPYIDLLPRSVPVPATWSKLERAALHDESAAAEAGQHRMDFVTRYNKLVTAIREVFRDINLSTANAAYAAHEIGIGIDAATRLGFGIGGGSASGNTITSGRSGSGSGSGSGGIGAKATPVPTELVDSVDLNRGSIDSGSDSVAKFGEGGKSVLNAIVSSDGSSDTAADGSDRSNDPAPDGLLPGLPGFGASHDSLQSFIWAVTLIDSRSLTIRGGRYLVPFSDFLNYQAAPGAEARKKSQGDTFLLYHLLDLGGAAGSKSRQKASTASTTSAVDGSAAVDERWSGGSFTGLVDRAVAPGEQVFEDYGDNDGSVYLQHHAMVPISFEHAASASASSAISGRSVVDVGRPSSLASAVEVKSGNPFDCMYLRPLPTIKQGPKGSIQAKRVALARALQYSPGWIDSVCIPPPKPPKLHQDGSSGLGSMEHASAGAASVGPDPVPLEVHRWMDIASMTMDDLSSIPCEAIVIKRSKHDQHQLKQQQSSRRAGEDDAAVEVEMQELARACFREADDANAALSFGASSTAFAVDSEASSGAAFKRRARITKTLRKMVASSPTSLAEDEAALAVLASDGFSPSPSTRAAAVTQSSTGLVSSENAACRVLANLSALRPEAAWLALAYRTTRKRMINTLLQYYARTGPWGKDAAASPAADEVTAAAYSAPADQHAASLPPVPPHAAAAPNVMLHVEKNEPAAASADATVRAESDGAVPAVVPSMAAANSAQAAASSSTHMVQIGLTSMPARDAAAYFTEAEYSTVLRQCEEFNKWFLSYGPAVAHVRAAPVSGGMRLGVVTMQPLKKQSIYLTVPTDIIMDLNSAHACTTIGPALKQLRKRFPGGDEFHELLFHLVTEVLIKGPHGNSSFQPYVNLLPDTDHMLFPTFYTDDELQHLNGSAILPAIHKYKEQLLRKYASLQSEILEKDSVTFPPSIYTMETYTWATAVIDSRSIWWAGKRHLVPLLDLINCNEGPDPTRVHATRLDQRGEYAVTRADRDYEAGEQLWENYGQPNWIYYHFHGFTLLQNSHDCVRIDVYPPQEMLDTMMTMAAKRSQERFNSSSSDSDSTSHGIVVPDYWSLVASELDTSDEAATNASLSAPLSSVLLSRRGKGPRMTAADRTNFVSRWADPKAGALQNCISVTHGPKLHTETEEAIKFIAIAWDTDRLGALMMLSGLARDRLKGYPRDVHDDVMVMLADAAAQVVLGLAAEEDAGASVESLLHYVYYASSLRPSNVTAPPSFETWQGLLLEYVRDGPAYAKARAALLPPRVRATVQYLITEKVQLLQLAGYDSRGSGSIYSYESSSASCGPDADREKDRNSNARPKPANSIVGASPSSTASATGTGITNSCASMLTSARADVQRQQREHG